MERCFQMCQIIYIVCENLFSSILIDHEIVRPVSPLHFKMADEPAVDHVTADVVKLNPFCTHVQSSIVEAAGVTPLVFAVVCSENTDGSEDDVEYATAII